ncbi:VOC family protein [Roseibium album]|uniref:VOC family protein n=1 Tax=Roseibium album TaxID=311410 RepID=UPI00248FA8F3|nr:VOC family protein [Roseibium album]
MPSEQFNSLRLGRIAAMLPVSDIERSYQVYKEVFGFEKVFENGDPVGFMILQKDEAELHLTLQKNHKAATFNVAHMLVFDATETYQRCQDHGLRIIKRLQDKNYGLRAFVFADPDGNRIDVGEPISPP